MKVDEVDLVLKYLQNIDTYLEWGSGGSTLNFALFANRRAVSIEHNQMWCDRMEKRMIKHNSGKFPKVEYHCVHNSTERVEGEGTYREFKDYVDTISFLHEPVWDFVFIDGRCRVCSAIKALSYISRSSIVVLHDSRRFFDEGRCYTPILNYYEVIESIGGSSKRGVAIMKRKKSLTHLSGRHKLVQAILDEYQRNLTIQNSGCLNNYDPEFV